MLIAPIAYKRWSVTSYQLGMHIQVGKGKHQEHGRAYVSAAAVAQFGSPTVAMLAIHVAPIPRSQI